MTKARLWSLGVVLAVAGLWLAVLEHPDPPARTDRETKAADADLAAAVMPTTPPTTPTTRSAPFAPAPRGLMGGLALTESGLEVGRAARRADHEDMHARFAAEKPDPDWAGATEASLTTLLKETGAGDFVTGLSCASSLCRLEIAAGDASRVSSLAAFARRSGALPTMPAIGDPQQALVVYLSRGHAPGS